MSIEELLKENTAAVNRNTEALLALAASGGTTPTSAKTTGKGAGKAAAKTEETTGPKHTQSEVNAALIKLKDDFDISHAKKIVSEVGGVDKMGDIPADKYDAVYDAAVAKHEELSNAGSSGDGL